MPDIDNPYGMRYNQTSVWMPGAVKPAFKAILMAKNATMSQFFNACIFALIAGDIKIKRTNPFNSIAHQSLANSVHKPEDFYKSLGVILTDKSGEVINVTPVGDVFNNDTVVQTTLNTLDD